MRLQQPPDPEQLARVALDDRVRVADVDRDEADPFDLLGLSDVDQAEVLLDQPAAEHPGGHLAWADLHRHDLGAGLLGEPACGDPRAVAGQLGLRAVGVPDHELEPVLPARSDLEDPVGVADFCAHGLGRERLLSDEVDVPLRLPARRSHRRAPPLDGQRRA